MSSTTDIRLLIYAYLLPMVDLNVTAIGHPLFFTLVLKQVKIGGSLLLFRTILSQDWNLPFYILSRLMCGCTVVVIAF